MNGVGVFNGVDIKKGSICEPHQRVLVEKKSRRDKPISHRDTIGIFCNPARYVFMALIFHGLVASAERYRAKCYTARGWRG